MRLRHEPVVQRGATPGEEAPPPMRRTLRRMYDDKSHFLEHEFLHALEQVEPYTFFFFFVISLEPRVE